MGKYLLGLDAGNTVIKVVIFDCTGRELAQAGAEGRSRMPCPSHVERDLGELWTNARRVIRICIDKAAIAATETDFMRLIAKADRFSESSRLIQERRAFWRNGRRKAMATELIR